jgi:O-antigen chain-terminating methyltransferase
MNDAPPRADGSIKALVAALPEKYQPIFGHPELSDGSSRGCEDRLALILAAAQRLQGALGRPLRVLDLGCAQGFFSLNLAAAGHSVHGADFLDRNVDVCAALAAEAGLAKATFRCARIEDVAAALQADTYDLVLGLSVFHHLVHEHGLPPIVEIIAGIADKIGCGIYEVAVREEPLYWGPSQPKHASELLAPYAFLRVMSWQPTHLSGVERPLYFASQKYWYVGDDFRAFDSWRFQSHSMDMSSHQQSRRYFFSKHALLKQYSLVNPARREFNREEYENEAGFLAVPPPQMRTPAMIEAVVDRQDCWLAREMLPGRLLLKLMDEHVPYAAERVVDGLIRQLVLLEECGLYHNDVRCWNLMIDGDSEPYLIDFGAISKTRSDCVWPVDLLVSLLITVREIFMAHVGPVLPVRRGLLDISMLPMRYQTAFANALAKPRDAWSFRELSDGIKAWAGESIEFPGYVAAISAAERGMLSLEGTLAAERHEGRVARENLARSLDEARTELTRSLEGARAELTSSREDAHRWHLLAAQRDDEIAALNDRTVSTTVSHGALQRRMEGLLAQLAVQEAESRRVGEDNAALGKSVQEWQARADELNHLLLLVRGSWSWKLTAPLRGLKLLVRQPTAFTRRIVLAGMRRVVRYPVMARRLNSLAQLFPPLHAKLISVAVNNRIIADVPAPIEQEGIVGGVSSFTGLTERDGLDRLSIRGKAFYQGIANGNRKEAR